MDKFILDFGSGNTCRNSTDLITEMIDQFWLIIKESDGPSPDFVVKWQLFRSAGVNVPMTLDSFRHAHEYGTGRGFITTASVFDEWSLRALLEFEVKLVKLANNADLWKLIPLIPEDVQIVISVGSEEDKHRLLVGYPDRAFKFLACVSDYPAKARDYRSRFLTKTLVSGISDHTQTWALVKRFTPDWYECHYKLENSKGLDAGPFARTPKQLKELFYGS